VDTEEYEEVLRKHDYPVHPKVLEFLRSFGGLHVVHPHARVPEETDDFHLDPIESVRLSVPAWARAYSERVNAPLCVIGQARRGYALLTMDPGGAVYSGVDNILRKVGDSGTDAIEALCSGRDLEKVSEGAPPCR
jgi:hypothetical protein